MALEQVGAHGAGVQIHMEDLAGHLTGRERCDARARWAQLVASYQHLASNTGLHQPADG